MATIIVDNLITATDASVLTGTRLLTVGPGLLIVEFQSDVNTAAANFQASLQLPDGSNPFSNIHVPGSNPALDGVLDERQKFMAVYRITNTITGPGHVVLGFTETGTAVMFWRVTHKS